MRCIVAGPTGRRYFTFSLRARSSLARAAAMTSLNRFLGDVEDLAGQVDEFAADPVGPDGDRHDPAGPQQERGLDQDLGEAVQQGGQALMGQVGSVAGVVVVPLTDARLAGVAGGLHWFRRLRIRWEIRDDMREAFMTLATAIICWRRLVR
ncbi:hypothetical protein [Microtetraspora malaysiensis]|uniref:hypothetical protein n=1 Tax=Microtetraspora malaysiensis TaxID=161358 RepID=UPI003D910359